MKRLVKNHPLLLLPVIGTIIGILCAHYFALSCMMVICLSVFTLGLFFAGHNNYFSYTSLLVFVGIGMLLFTLQTYHFNALSKQFLYKNLDVIGTITAKEKIVSQYYQEVLTVNVRKVREAKQKDFVATSFKLLCYTKRKPSFLPGDTIKLKNVFCKKPKLKNLTGNTSFLNYSIKENILGSIFLNKKVFLQKISRPSLSIRRLLWQAKNNLYLRIKHKLSKTGTLYFSLIFLGNKQLPEAHSLRQTFSLWGLSHFLARSGLHIVLFIFLWRFLLSFVPLHLFIKTVILILICFFYNLLSWTSLSFSRAYHIFLLLQLGILGTQHVRFQHILLLTTLCLLLFNPMQIFFLDFQLSFGLTFILSFFSKQQKNT